MELSTFSTLIYIRRISTVQHENAIHYSYFFLQLKNPMNLARMKKNNHLTERRVSFRFDSHVWMLVPLFSSFNEVFKDSCNSHDKSYTKHILVRSFIHPFISRIHSVSFSLPLYHYLMNSGWSDYYQSIDIERESESESESALIAFICLRGLWNVQFPSMW